MSNTDYSQVIAGSGFTVPAHAALQLRGPDTLYQLGQGQTASVEAVNFQIDIDGVATFALRFRLELTDPSGNLIFQNTTPLLKME